MENDGPHIMGAREMVVIGLGLDTLTNGQKSVLGESRKSGKMTYGIISSKEAQEHLEKIEAHWQVHFCY